MSLATSKCRWKENHETDLADIGNGGTDWIKLAQKSN
jgi:hypothetical protein